MLENVNKNETIDYDELKKEILQDLNDGNVNIVLTAAEYYIYEAVTWPDLSKLEERIMLEALRYNSMEEVYVEDDDDMIIKLKEDILSDMCKMDQVFEEYVQQYLKSRKDLFGLAKNIYESVLESSVSDEYKKQCSDALKRYFV